MANFQPPPPSEMRKGLLGELLETQSPAAQAVAEKQQADVLADMLSKSKQGLVSPELNPHRLSPYPSSFCLSFEFFPPHTDEGLEKLKITTRMLGEFYPAYYSVTFGTADNVQNFTVQTVQVLKKYCITPIAPHISCMGATSDYIRELLQTYRQMGVRRLVVLRGDKFSRIMHTMGQFNYAADLVEFIRKEHGDYFFIEVAAYPECHLESMNPEHDVQYFCAKVNKGAGGAITQHFYNKDSYYYFVDRCRQAGISVPIVPGVMPITNFHQLQRFSDSCGAEIPRWMRLRLAKYADDPVSLQALGQELVTRMCQDLLDDGVPGLHFYTLNKAEPSINICQDLQWK